MVPRGYGQVDQGVEPALVGRLILSVLQRDDVALPPFNNGEHVIGPPRQRGRYFALIAISIIDRFDAALNVIDRQLGDMRLDIQLAQVGAHSSPQIVQSPRRERLAFGLNNPGV
jgi:hypothetical protein